MSDESLAAEAPKQPQTLIDLVNSIIKLDEAGAWKLTVLAHNEESARVAREHLAEHDKRRAEIYAAALAAGLSGKLAEELKR